jgi:hypothetical protein
MRFEFWILYIKFDVSINRVNFFSFANKNVPVIFFEKFIYSKSKIYYLKFLKYVLKTLVSIVFSFDNYNYRKMFNYCELIGEESNT